MLSVSISLEHVRLDRAGAVLHLALVIWRLTISNWGELDPLNLTANYRRSRYSIQICMGLQRILHIQACFHRNSRGISEYLYYLYRMVWKVQLIFCNLINSFKSAFLDVWRSLFVDFFNHTVHIVSEQALFEPYGIVSALLNWIWLHYLYRS